LRECHTNHLAVVIATSAVSDELDVLLERLQAGDASDATGERLDQFHASPLAALLR
jgi:phosphoglycolate phosphatase-like HAD superfamily hydrolase